MSSEKVAAARSLPRFVVLQSIYNNKYLRYVHEDSQVHSFLQFSGEEVVSPYAKLQVERAKAGKGLVHLRCCYNNKYLVRWSTNHWWLVAGADEPEEDTSKWTCTLFEPHFDIKGIPNNVAFKHVQLQHYACLMPIEEPFKNCFFAGESSGPTLNDLYIFSFVDWETLLVIPKHVAFKGCNGKYLSAHWQEDYRYLQFNSTDIGSQWVGNQVFITPDGAIRIKNNYFGKFWRRSNNWIWADSDDTTSKNPDTLFWPVKVGKNIVALRNLGNNRFCASLTTEGKSDCLNAAVPTISNEAKLEVHELVLSRDIYNVDFRLLDARIYDQIPSTMATGVAVNKTQQTQNHEIKLKYSETKKSTWNSSVSLKLGVETTIKTGIPFLADGKVTISAELSGGYEWGGSKESTTEIETVYKVEVPPKTSITVRLLATTGSCDIPFSYTQHDTLTSGEKVTYEMDDGVYTGISSYNFKYETEETKL